MSSRRCLLLVSLLAGSLHALGISGSILPAQDGLKFIRVARQFQTQPWSDVVRGSDQHPLYPALIALTQPIVAIGAGNGPGSWRIAAQLVSAVAYLLLLWPLHGLTSKLFDEKVANLCVFLFALLPIPAELGRDTLSDIPALLCFTAALMFAQRALIDGRTTNWIGAGAAIGLGYLARPEVALVAVSLGLLVVAPIVLSAFHGENSRRDSTLASLGGLGSAGLVTLVLVGAYALVKGEVSEKLALRTSVALGASKLAQARKSAEHPLPAGLVGRSFDFSPKEESGRTSLKGKTLRVAGRLAHEWIEGIGWIFAPFAAWGLIGSRRWSGSKIGRRLVLIQIALFLIVVIQHASTLGYLSGRHAMSLVVLSMPFAAAAIWHWASGVPRRRGLSLRAGRSLAFIGLSGLFLLGVSAQAKGMHPSRWGHRRAGDWLIEHARPDEAVLDTRGWAAFVRGEPSYDYWHVRQALSDAHLRYLVVESDELEARSARAETLKTLLDQAGERVATFPDRQEATSVSSVYIYRFVRPEHWEGRSK